MQKSFAPEIDAMERKVVTISNLRAVGKKDAVPKI